MKENMITCARCGFAYNLAREPLCRNCGQPLTAAGSAAWQPVAYPPPQVVAPPTAYAAPVVPPQPGRASPTGAYPPPQSPPLWVCRAAQEVKRLAYRAHCSHGRGRRSGVFCPAARRFYDGLQFDCLWEWDTPVSLLGKLTPNLPLNEQRVLSCAKSTCLVKVELDTITLFHTSYPESYWAFTITASQYCTGLYLKESSLKNSQGATFPGIREKWPENGVVYQGRAYDMAIMFPVSSGVGNAYQLTISVSGDCYTTDDQFAVETLHF